MYTNILIPTDGSELAELAVEKGLELAKALGSQVTFITVVEPYPALGSFGLAETAALAETLQTFQREADAGAKALLARAEARAEAAGVSAATRQVESGYPYEAIVATAAEVGADLIVMSSHGRKGVTAVLVGSETMKVLTHSKVPVLVLR